MIVLRTHGTHVPTHFAGPNSDFHGEQLELADILGEQCVSVKLTNILGQESIIKTGESFSRKTLWGVTQ